MTNKISFRSGYTTIGKYKILIKLYQIFDQLFIIKLIKFYVWNINADINVGNYDKVFVE